VWPRVELVTVLREVADDHVVPAPQLAGGRLAAPGQGVDQRGLAGAVGADEGDVLAALEPQLHVVEQGPVAGHDAPVLEFEDHAPRPRRRRESECQRARLALGAPVAAAIEPLEALDPRLRLARTGAVAKAGHEPLELLALGCLARGRPPGGELAYRLLLAPGVPRT
jgi:hypothetical protein